LPDGAVYVYADISAIARTAGGRVEDSTEFARRLLNEAGVCLVPGEDFGEVDAGRYVRLSYAASMIHLEEAVERIRAWLARG
jgi:aspartate/methionine/tyrosine aminotransferase